MNGGEKPLATSSSTKNTWGENPRAGGTLESVVKQATLFRRGKPTVEGGGDDLVPCLDAYRAAAGDALVPTAATAPGQGIGMCGVGSSARVGSCCGHNSRDKRPLKRAKMARVPVAHDDDSNSRSESGRDSWQLTSGSREWELGARGFTSSSMGSPENTSSDEWSTEATTNDDRDTVGHCRSKRRRDKINQRMKTLQQLVPNASKIDKVSMLDEVIEHLKQLQQAQVVMMSRMMNMSYMMLPMALQQHLQLSLMASMGMGLRMGSGMGMGVMDINAATGFPNITAGISPVSHPAAYMPLISWDRSGDCFSTPAMVVPDPVSTFLACQSQPTMDGYSRMASLYQQLHLPLLPGFNN